jgi:hypothetical protein
MAKDDSGDDSGYARHTIDLQHAFLDLCRKLKRGYEQTPRNEAEMLSQHVLALLEVARFLNRMGPDYLAHVADQFAKLAQTLQDVHDGVRAPILNPAIANRGDPTQVWLARAHVAVAVETLQWCGHSRQSAAQWAAKQYPGLKRVIVESSGHRSGSIEKVIISWCRDFKRGKVKNHYASRAYSVGLDKLIAHVPKCSRDQNETEADRLLQQAVALLCKECGE